MSVERGGRLELGTQEVEEPGMLMTSMVDVIFILLAFFVCVTEIKKGKLEVEVPDVPSVDALDPADTGPPVVVEVTGEDAVFVDGQRASDEAELTRLLQAAALARGTEVSVHLSGDRAATNGTMMRVVSRLSEAGLRRIQFVVQVGG